MVFQWSAPSRQGQTTGSEANDANTPAVACETQEFKEAAILSQRSVETVLQKPMQWEHHIESNIESDTRIPDTEREALIVARRGQGLFKQRVMEIERS